MNFSSWSTKKKKGSILGTCTILIIILFIILLFGVGVLIYFSIHRLIYNELGLIIFKNLKKYIGIKYDTWTGRIGDKVYEPGIHFLFFTQKFIKYPKFLQTLIFSDNSDDDSSIFQKDSPSIKGRTKEGVTIQFDIIIYFKLNEDLLINLQYDFGKTYENVFLDEAKSIVLQVISEYYTLEIQNNRQNFTDKLWFELEKKFNDIGIASVKDMAIGHIYIWQTFEDAVESKLVEEQYNIELNSIREIDLIEKDMDKIYTEAQYDINEINAIANSQIYIYEKYTERNKTDYETKKNIELFEKLKDIYGGSQSFVNNYYWYNTLMQKSNVHFIYNLLDNQYIDIKYGN